MAQEKPADRWLTEAVRHADPRAEVVVLEDSRVRDILDGHIHRIWPPVREHLESTGYVFTPERDVKIESRSRHALVRAMSWMLHDGVQAIHRGTLECNRDHWMLDREFFLSMPGSTDLGLVREIIGNSRLGGSPPELTIHKHSPAGYYQILFRAGSGEDWGTGSNERIVGRIKKCIDCNIRMHEIAIDGEWDRETVEEFLTTAFAFYESY